MVVDVEGGEARGLTSGIGVDDNLDIARVVDLVLSPVDVAVRELDTDWYAEVDTVVGEAAVVVCILESSDILTFPTVICDWDLGTWRGVTATGLGSTGWTGCRDGVTRR